MTLPVLADRETGELVEDPVAYMTLALNRAKGGPEEAQSIDEVRQARAVAMGYEVVIREKELAFDAQLSATELVRRYERGIDQLLPRHRGSAPAGSEVNVEQAYGGGRARSESHAMGRVDSDAFDAAIDGARAEGNLSRANVVRKIRGDVRAARP